MVVLQIALGVVGRRDVTIVANEVFSLGGFLFFHFVNLHLNLIVGIVSIVGSRNLLGVDGFFGFGEFRHSRLFGRRCGV